DKLPNLFAGGRDIGDEYRYILERRYALKFPGNMLPRPGLLLNPWEKRSTDLNAMSQSGTEAASASAGGRGGASGGEHSMRYSGPTTGAANNTNLDFLANVAPVLYNLVPDANGVIVVPRKALGDRQQIQVYAEDLTGA